MAKMIEHAKKAHRDNLVKSLIEKGKAMQATSKPTADSGNSTTAS